MKARNRELLAMIPASLLVTAGFAGVFIQRSNALSNVSLTYGAIFLGLCLAAHIFIRMTLPHAQLLSRRFVLIPALELDFALRTPSGASLADALAALAPEEGVRWAGSPLTRPGS